MLTPLSHQAEEALPTDSPDRTEVVWIPKPTTQTTGQAIEVDEAILEKADCAHRIIEGIPCPIAFGTYKSDPHKHFYLAEFMEMTAGLPDIRAFSAMLAKLHHDSMVDPKAPREFGYDFMTHEGSMYQDIKWRKTWEELYSQRFQSFVDQELASQGPSEEVERLVLGLKEKVIPRLLRPLNTHRRKLRPVALHGDIWCGNIATNAVTGEPVYFDPAVFWGHNEYDVGSMATPRYKLGREWMQEYHKFFPISAPECDYEDRNVLYAISGHLCASALYPEKSDFRKMAVVDMQRLLDKYPDGYQGE
ncbi:hypothetical protein J4E90_007707 [Alternaria incomplexa]|uniref:uncharacterized protein n=1 Tax=Alternaria incomplexa TaxID=1187928 RepID=UPI00221F0D2C|nr:uncharacterized protein J4E90_007707 [Alternaria incomplexa]KAI4910274.1 hypothetical protein J4E90_007707 [Alternaria incomplexa]